MMEGLVDCAHGLAARYCEAAGAEADNRLSLQLFDGFYKSAFAVRMGIRLCMTLRAPPKAASTAAERADPSEEERAEHEPDERPEPLERERDRDYEPISLPRFLSTLGLVAKGAERLGDRLPDAADVLPRLKGLLAEANPASPAAPTPPAQHATSGVAVLARPPQVSTRRNLLGSGAPPRPDPRWTGSG